MRDRLPNHDRRKPEPTSRIGGIAQSVKESLGSSVAWSIPRVPEGCAGLLFRNEAFPITSAKTDRVADADVVLRGGAGDAHGDVKVDLLVRRQLVCSSKMEQLPRAATIREIAGIFHEGVPGFSELPVEEKGGFAGEIVLLRKRGPAERDLAACRPLRRHLGAPRQLQAGVVSSTRHPASAGRETHKNDGRKVESAEMVRAVV